MLHDDAVPVLDAEAKVAGVVGDGQLPETGQLILNCKNMEQVELQSRAAWQGLEFCVITHIPHLLASNNIFPLFRRVVTIHRLNFERLNFERPNFERLNFEKDSTSND
jgi:hypothetical protein